MKTTNLLLSLFLVSDRKKLNFLFAPIGNRNFSTSNGNCSKGIKPEVIYVNADTQKIEIFRDNKGKSGIYR